MEGRSRRQPSHRQSGSRVRAGHSSGLRREKCRLKQAADFERKLYVVCKRVEREVERQELDRLESFYIASLSAETIVYKGLLTAPQIPGLLSGSGRPFSEERPVSGSLAASAPTPFPPGSWLILTGTWPITEKSIRFAVTATGCAPVPRRSPRTSSARISPRFSLWFPIRPATAPPSTTPCSSWSREAGPLPTR